MTQPLQIVPLDGVPTGSQDGTRRGKLVTGSDILIPPAGRAEFIVFGPSVQVKHATFLTLPSIPVPVATTIRNGRSPPSTRPTTRRWR